ncbi:MAG: mannose-6-phosphate isomerase, class I [Corynebacterium sp.]|uniref:mannose-6-phosphate isomerase, class I n=1 Tax=Corynebacterium sp. TaxID=1720 RepID=UPI0026DC6341|nr:mannose-6-phosphate isomerase, class I [Corynebacterium sp.]MDO4761591.1 mannose-6-phosphate isomerase, class I [Corynebacterium sp.]
MLFLSPRTQAYPWGSKTLIAGLRGDSHPSNCPEAELWYGAHPALPSLVDGVGLDAIIAQDPQYHLGAKVTARHGSRLPFLLKILAADEPLSLQAHPSREQAMEGFERENSLGIDIRAPHRNYRDDNHKPELIVALSRFHAMAGFRPVDETLALFEALDCPELSRYSSMLGGEDDTTQEAELRGLFTTWITIPVAVRKQLIDAIVARAKVMATSVDMYPEWMVLTASNVVDLHRHYPGDVGVLGGLLLNYIILEPGEAIYLDAGNLHAYCRGLGVEIMANSDNVLRGGLTSKHVDVPELVKVLKFEPLDDPRLESNHGHFTVPIDEFDLRIVDVDGASQVESSGPRIVLCTSGQVDVRNSNQCETLHPSQALWVPAGDSDRLDFVGKGQLFLARV